MAEIEDMRIGIVDDDQAARDSLSFLLETSGYAVEAFASAAELLAVGSGHLTCLILDQNMPAMTGLELVEKLQDEGQALPIMLVTGTPTPSVVGRAAELGVKKVLGKPPEESDLLEFINGCSS